MFYQQIPFPFERLHLIIYMIWDNKQLLTAHAHIRGVVRTTTGWLV
ncbi:hypothetical protein HMPREF6745_1722 [Prevotella sp. oral taxon 472 str. F0295]|nr:hypothetical protein HMPREF6745_1722 [Prevotella sp. oral taxon 472 str. F0295]